MNPADELRDQGYSLDAALNHKELIPFVVEYLFRRNFFTLSFLVLNLIFFIAWLVFCILEIHLDTITPGSAFEYSVYGTLITFLLVPFHEGLHGLSYRLCGAKKISYQANWRKLYFMAIADHFMAGRRAFYFIGFTPFVVISMVLIALGMFSDGELRIMWFTTLWIHASMCAGDIGLLSYFREQKNREVITYDDAVNSMSYFYSRPIHL